MDRVAESLLRSRPWLRQTDRHGVILAVRQQISEGGIG